MKRGAVKSIGTFDLGTRTAAVYVDPTTYNAHFKFVDETIGGRSRMVIGIKDDRFRASLSNAMHEATEMVFTEMGLRYVPSPEIGDDNGAYMFTMSHTKFSEAMARVSVFVNFLYPVLKKAHEKYHESKSNRRR